uniref:Putative ovule protein n=1 Tax=Solanum chacoense TaxID=4108 RepID=A0A0V0HLH3_SOLCH
MSPKSTPRKLTQIKPKSPFIAIEKLMLILLSASSINNILIKINQNVSKCTLQRLTQNTSKTQNPFYHYRVVHRTEKLKEQKS